MSTIIHDSPTAVREESAMRVASNVLTPPVVSVHVLARGELERSAGLGRLLATFSARGEFDQRWLRAVCNGLGHDPYLLVARREGNVCGLLPLAHVQSWLFGRFLVSLPYVNTAGVIADDEQVAAALIDRAAELADKFNVRSLQLRHERETEHPRLDQTLTGKVHMRLALPATADALWSQLKAKVRNQIRKGQRSELTVEWGRHELLDDYYDVFAANMRDLGTPVFGRGLFESILTQFEGDAELCVTRLAGRPVAAALLVHGTGRTEVPSASSLRQFNGTNANMLMYWHLLERAIERGQPVFDFGRSTEDGPTYRFKKQWGAEPSPACWQYCVRQGTVDEVRPDGGKFGLAIRVWQRLPIWLTRLIGPGIVRGIP